MAGRGGYRKPSRPAAVSGPGSYSKRTDGKAGQAIRDIPANEYGDASSFRQMQQAAPMEQAGATPNIPVPTGGGAPSAPIVPMGAPTQLPNQPVTTGNPLGPGAGPEAIAGPQPGLRLSQSLQQLINNDTDGSVGDLILELEKQGY